MADETAQIDEMFLGGRAFLERRGAPLGDKLLWGKGSCHAISRGVIVLSAPSYSMPTGICKQAAHLCPQHWTHHVVPALGRDVVSIGTYGPYHLLAGLRMLALGVLSFHHREEVCARHSPVLLPAMRLSSYLRQSHRTALMFCIPVHH